MRLQGPVFYLEDIDHYGLAWMEYERQIDYAIYCAEIPVLEGQQKYSRKEGDTTYRPVIDQAGHLGWLGDPIGEGAVDISQAGKKLKLYVRDGRALDGRMCPMPGCHHAARTITVYLCGADQDAKEAEQVSEVDSPFAHSSFKRTAARKRNSRNPHLRFRSPLVPMIIEAAEINHDETLLSKQEREDYLGGGNYLTVSDMNPDIQIGEEGGVKESYPRPIPGANELPVLPSELREMTTK